MAHEKRGNWATPMTHIALLSTSLTLLLSGCGKLTEFEISQDVQEQVVQGSAAAGVLADFGFRIPINIDLEAETNERNTGPAKRVELKALRLSITETKEPEGDSDNFNFLDSVEVYVESKRDGSDLEKKKVAEIPKVPMGVRKIEFDTNRNVNLKPYIEQGTRMTATGEGSAPEDDVSFAGKGVFLVEVL